MSDNEIIAKMQANTVKQAIDGLKYEIADALKTEYKDAHRDFTGVSAAECAEVYAAILEDVFDKLARLGIDIPELIGSEFFR